MEILTDDKLEARVMETIKLMGMAHISEFDEFKTVLRTHNRDDQIMKGKEEHRSDYTQVREKRRESEKPMVYEKVQGPIGRGYEQARCH